MKDNHPITWIQFNNIVPIITSAIIIALSWGALTSRLSLIEQKVDFIATTLESHYEEAKDDAKDIQEIQRQLAIIKNVLQL